MFRFPLDTPKAPVLTSVFENCRRSHRKPPNPSNPSNQEQLKRYSDQQINRPPLMATTFVLRQPNALLEMHHGRMQSEFLRREFWGRAAGWKYLPSMKVSMSYGTCGSTTADL
jgi:hypothetical protein